MGDHLSNINKFFIYMVFSLYRNQFSETSNYEKPELSENVEYKILKKVLSKTVLSFYESIYLDNSTADYYLRLCEDSSRIFPLILVDPEDTDDGLLDGLVPSESSFTVFVKKLCMSELLKVFILIYEMKFIFGDVNSKFDINYLLD
ncbi:hypothetical protein RF11_08200 [Thelohanellus kitauei]|uniref:Uncharacterized protein n=1 Tax=Thelohanellus kitauei TaxID=669202 RepID=A0A0C2J7P1_THEKT|nr:hypothetical protein RF11_08200 [Thelohanellus kitauei]